MLKPFGTCICLLALLGFDVLSIMITSANCPSNRGENGELRVGVRRLMRQLNNMPSSVISSHSMHLGVLATASHAKSTGTLFSVFYKPRFDSFILLVYTYIVQCFLYSRHDKLETWNVLYVCTLSMN
jgi:hypothetical protein